MVFFLLHTFKVSYVCMGITTSPKEGKYCMVGYKLKFTFQTKPLEDLQQCRIPAFLMVRGQNAC
jgi:hypothetical protein